MMTIEAYVPAALADDVRAALEGNPLVSALAIVPGGSVVPEGDLVKADVPREVTNGVIESLRQMGVPRVGTVHLSPVPTWISRAGLTASHDAPGTSSDVVVWADVTQDAYRDSTLSWSYLTFMSLATLIASIAIIVDSSILVIGAMVLGPEFGAIAALGIALVQRRRVLLGRAALALVAGFGVGISMATLLALVGRAVGWIEPDALARAREGTSFIYSPDRWSILIALIAGAAGVLAMTSERRGGLVGVFISVTTIPAAGNFALALALWEVDQMAGSGLQLGINLTGMALAGWLTLVLQQALWKRVPMAQPLRKITRRSDPRAGH